MQWLGGGKGSLEAPNFRKYRIAYGHCRYACMQACMYICMYACMYICMYVSVYVYIYSFVGVFVCMYVVYCVCTYIYKYRPMYNCVYVSIYLRMYMYACAQSTDDLMPPVQPVHCHTAAVSPGLLTQRSPLQPANPRWPSVSAHPHADTSPPHRHAAVPALDAPPS